MPLRYTKDVVCAAKALSESCFVAAVGCNVLKYMLNETKSSRASKASTAGRLGLVLGGFGGSIRLIQKMAQMDGLIMDGKYIYIYLNTHIGNLMYGI